MAGDVSRADRDDVAGNVCLSGLEVDVRTNVTRKPVQGWLIVALVLALYAVVGTIEARDEDNRRPVAMVAR